MNIYTVLDEMKQQDLSAIKTHYDTLIEAETKASEARAERLRELVSVEKAESKTRIEALQAGKLIALAQVEQRYSAPNQSIAEDEAVGVVVTGSAHNASSN